VNKSKKYKFNDIFNAVSIDKAGGEGKAIGFVDDKVVFVKGGAPGDVADIRLTKIKRRYFEAEIHHLIQASPVRQDPFCEHFGTCGGCKWQHIQYPEQLKFKNQWALDCLQRIGKVQIEHIEEPLGAKETEFYRNKLEFTFSDKVWEDQFDKENPKGIPGLGFHMPGRWDKILDIKHCHLMKEPVNKLRNRVKEIAVNNSYVFWNPVSQQGWLRNMLVRSSSLGDLLVVFSVSENLRSQLEELFETLIPEFPEVNSWMFTINDKKNDSWTNLEPILYKGKGFLEEKMENLKFKIQPFSFFQTNLEQALSLYEIVRNWAALSEDEIVYDLYTGTGTIAQFIASKAKKVIGIEYVESSVADAKENAKINKIDNAAFFTGDMKALLTAEFFATHGKPDVIITDPPRDGMHPDVIQRIIEAAPERIVYVSCNPATQARDLALLSENYHMERSKSVDMFPHTHHVENVVLLRLKSIES
jgi:23S rRNA (uracil1939-C5)-methyltransferase